MTSPPPAATEGPRSRAPGLRRVLLAAIRFYQRAISPALPPRCRFWPSCSAYAAEAVEVHGAARGSWLALRRIARCAPWHPGGVDPVPPAPGTRGSGTRDTAGSSSRAVPVPGSTSAVRRPPPATPPPPVPDRQRVAQEESSVA